MRITTLLTVTAVAAGLLVGGAVQNAAAQEQEPFRAADFEYGSRFELPDGTTAQIWNPAKAKLVAGGPMIGGTVRATDPRTYCAMAAAGYDFVWVEMQHESISWEQVSRDVADLPGTGGPRRARGLRRRARDPARHGHGRAGHRRADRRQRRRGSGGGGLDLLPAHRPGGARAAARARAELWNQVPGGYRQTYNDNVVLILMIETLEGVEASREIAQIPGVTGLFAASGDLGNFSGFSEGDAEYEALITEVRDAAIDAGIHACAPLRWADRASFTCFQAGTEAANIRRGAAAEIQQANEAFGATGGGAPVERSGAAGLLAELTAQCGSITYEDDCYAAVRNAAGAAGDLSDDEQAQIVRRLREVMGNNPNQAARIGEIAAAAGLSVQ